MLTDRELEEKNIHMHAPKRRTLLGRPPVFHASGSDPDIVTRRSPWIFVDCIQPNEEQTRRMWCDAIEVLISKTMRNHCYMFKNRIYRQDEGGSIGLDLTGVISEIYMSW